MSTVYANVMVKNEEILLRNILPIWKEYPIEKFVFLNDRSTDNTVDVIKHFLAERAHIIDRETDQFHEAKNRSAMLEWSRNKADFVIAIDADELLTSNFLENWNSIFEYSKHYDLKLFWFNVVNSINKVRNDPAYVNNFRTFILNTKTCSSFDLSGERYHTPRTPVAGLQPIATKDVGVIHLQALNVKHYALKQLWYKHYEYVNYGYDENFINSKYDYVINGLQFNEVEMNKSLTKNLFFDAKVFDEISDAKKYNEFIKYHYNEKLITFGKEFIK